MKLRLTVIVVLSVLAYSSIGQAATFQILHKFKFSTGQWSQAGLAQDAAGALYGTTSGGGAYGHGTVFRLLPPLPGHNAWRYKILHSFNGADGDYPVSRIAIGKDGALYGTTMQGGGSSSGTLFRLAPAKGGKWVLQQVHEFDGTFGSYPVAGVLIGSDGALYGTTQAGTVYRFIQTASGWDGNLLYRFSSEADGDMPSSELIMDASGALYGTTHGGGAHECFPGQNCGTVFKLAPSLGGWIKTTLHDFEGGTDGALPSSELIMDPDGALYGTTGYGGTPGFCCVSGPGTVFKLTPNGSGWDETLLYVFSGGSDSGYPLSGLARDASGALYGTTQGSGVTFGSGTVYDNGTVFKLTPSAGGWNKTILHAFSDKFARDGANPIGTPLLDSSGVVYGTAFHGTKVSGGSAFKISP